MKNNLFSKFTPKEPKFYPLLSELADVVYRASELIIEASKATSNAEATEHFKRVKEEERKGDRVQNKIFDELNNTFITPFDREDINNLASTMDDVTDYINSCAKRIMLYNPKRIPQSATKLAEIVRESAGVVVQAVGELDILKKNSSRIAEYCSQLAELEHKADDVYEHFLIDLFENEKDAVEIIKLKDILHELERATDAAENVGKVIKTIIVKYS
ncbi:MAG: phosphate transport regulator [Bacteroidales bacterium 45-6]|nr:MAG: phosphate transport regulator [Bacteroidales bacterium 45-6]